MKKADLFFNIAVVVLVIGIIAVILFKFVIREKNVGVFDIKELDNIVVTDLNGNKMELVNLLDKESDTFCLLFELTNCYSCIYNGVEDIKRLKDSGSFCIAIAVHDVVDEINGWSKNHDFSPFFVLKKSDFYKYIQSSLMPVIFKINKGKVENFRFITP